MARLVHAIAAFALLAPLAAGLPTPDALTAPVLQHVPHGPIVINGDAAFCASPVFSGVSNCDTANGSAAAPYLIRGWNIQASPSLALPAITITNTTKHVRVTGNQFITGSADAIPTVVLRHVANAALDNNTIRGGRAEALIVEDAAPDGRFLADNVFLAGLVDGASITLVRVTHLAGGTSASNSFRASPRNAALVAALFALSDVRDHRFESTSLAGSNGTGIALTDSDHVTFVSTTIETVRTGFALTSATNSVIAGVNATRVLTGVTATDSGTLALSSAMMMDSFPCSPACVPSVGVGTTRTNLALANSNLTGFDTAVLVAQRPTTPDTSTSVRCTTIQGNDVGISGDLANASIVRSNLVGNGVSVRNTARGDLDAALDWWGRVGGPPAAPAPNHVEGHVDVEWPLAGPSSCAPPPA